MRKSVFIFAIWVCHFIDVNGQNTVQIQATTLINLNKDDLVITCSASGSLQSIVFYSIARNSTTETEKTVVTSQYNVVNQQITTTWGDLSLQTRANLTGGAMPSPSATMVLTIPKNQVRCPQDAVGYQCKFIANPNTPNDPITTQTDYRYVDIQDPTSMEPVTISAKYNGQNVCTEDHSDRNIYRVGTTLTLSCTGMIGNPQRVPQWCYKKTTDFNWLAPALGVTNSPAIMVGCNYQMTTTLEYNVTAGDDDVVFMCESGANNLCGFGNISSNKTIYLVHVDPNSMEPMTIGAKYKSQNVCTEDHTGRHVFRIGTTLTFSCTGMIGNPQRVPRWCYKKRTDFNWLAVAVGVTNNPARMVGCSYQMTTTLEYNVTAGDDDVMFMCESGANKLCGFDDISSNKTIYLAHEKENTPKRVDDTCNGAAMFAAGFSSCLGLLLIVGISYLLARKYRIHKAAEPTNNQTNNVNPYDNLHVQNNTDVALYTTLSPTQPS